MDTLSRRETETKIVERAWKDDAFREEFVSDPKAAIEKYSGQKLPAEVKILAHVEDEQTTHFVIPMKPANADQLSDEDLEKVAGGIDIITGAIIATSVALGATVAGGAVGAAYVTAKDQGW